VRDAVENGYAGLLMRNRHPVGALFLEIDNKEIDVNVHPTKREVKFADANSVSRLIIKTVATAFDNTDMIPKATPKVKEEVRKPAKKEEKKDVAKPAIKPEQTLLSDDGPGEDISESQMLPRMKVIGQIMNTYILAQSGTDLLIIDQHAAHERVMLEKLKKAEKKRGKARQKLITPVPLSLDKRESQLIEHYRETIEDMGFIIEPFGKDTYLVRAIPVIGGHLEAEAGLLDLIHELAEFGRSKTIEEKKDEISHLVACHSAIRAGEKLSQNQIKRLIEEMHGIDRPYTCAHGRPTLIRITEKELEKLFRRS
jgi:DNA mismatch repair protein MutL